MEIRDNEIDIALLPKDFNDLAKTLEE